MQHRSKWAISIAFLLAGFLLMAAPRTAQAQGNPVQHSSGSFSVTFFDDATGEFVDINVTYKTDFHVVADGNGGFHVDVHDVYSGRGVGETSGTVYIANQTDNFSENLTAGALNETEPLHFSMISKGGADNLEVSELLHITIDANGNVTSFVDNVSVKTTGK